MLNSLQQVDSNNLSNHIFIGTVVSSDDPLKLERIKVRVPGLFESPSIDLLPWVGKYSGGPIPNGPDGAGSFGLVPRVGCRVFVMLQKGDSQYPLYWPSPLQPDTIVPEAGVNYPNVYGHKDPAGNVFKVDTTPGQVTITVQHKSGTKIVVNDNGSVEIVAVGAVTSTAPVWNHTGPVNIDGTLDVTGTIHSDIDVISDTVSGKNHVHPGVDRGGAATDPPAP